MSNNKNKFEDISNIFIEKTELESYDNIKIIDSEDRKDQFLLALATGFKNKEKKPIRNRHILFKTKYFKENDEALLNAITLYETGDVSKLTDKAEVYRIAEQYANAGIEILKQEDDIKHGNYLKKFEKNVIDSYNELKTLETNELDAYLSAGESSELEFKSTMRWDVKENNVNKSLQKVIAKSLAGFLNTNGGVLLIGVEDNGAIYGIEKDINTLNKKDMDGFEQTILQIIENHLGTLVTHYIKIKFVEKDKKYVCILTVKRSLDPVYLKDKNIKEFYIRAGNTTRPLDVEEAMKYIKIHWET